MASPSDDLVRSRSTGRMNSISSINSSSTSQRQSGSSAPAATMVDKYFIVAVCATFILAIIVYSSGLYSTHVFTLTSGYPPSGTPATQPKLRPTVDTTKILETFSPSMPPIEAPRVIKKPVKSSVQDADTSKPTPKPIRTSKPSVASDNAQVNEGKAGGSTKSTPTTTKKKDDGKLFTSDPIPIEDENGEVVVPKKSTRTRRPSSPPSALSSTKLHPSGNSSSHHHHSKKSPSKSGITIVHNPPKREAPVASSVARPPTKDNVAPADENPYLFPEDNVEPYGRDGDPNPARPRCGEPKSGSATRPCKDDDNHCGEWKMKSRFFHADNCKYQDITSAQARKCLGRRTLAFIGDSQIRDIAVAVAYFLMGETLDSAGDESFESHHRYDTNGTKIPDFSTWPFDNKDGNGYIFPQEKFRRYWRISWQIQYWQILKKKTVQEQGLDILNNLMPKSWSQLRPIDLAFWTHGIHDYGWFNTEPYDQLFYERIFEPWLEVKKNSSVPTVWVSMNPQCEFKTAGGVKGMKKGLHQIVDIVNKYMNQRLLKEKIPYWDAGSALRSPQRCDVSADGLHVKMYVDIMRAKMLFNHLCDEDMNWRTGTNAFI